GDLSILQDSFGHAQFSASGSTVGKLLINHLNGQDRKDKDGRSESRLIVPGIARSENPGTRQRRELAYVSEVDRQEAYQVGAYSAKLALEGEDGYMATIIRNPGKDYSVKYDKVALDIVANSEREFPKEWIAPTNDDVTDDYIRWAMPLIGGPLPEFSKFKEIYVSKKCDKYIPAGYAGK
ncbi:MAG: 6-phosphofructokinase, partial [Atribacterota bacterium]|nr:6-phosphofructokinase [Atribacterota bacterium]MDD4288744.1 6-phosphofructokinase [Atribacterota bacterium]